MPNVNKKLIATYLVHHFGVMTQVAGVDDDKGTLTFNFRNTQDCDTAYAAIQKLLPGVQAEIATQQSHKQEVTRTGNVITVSDSHASIKFLIDLKAVVVSVLAREEPKNFDPADFAEENYQFCEQLENYFVVPSIHKNILAAMENKFLNVGIRLCNTASKHMRYFLSKHPDYRTKEIPLILPAFDMAKFVKAVHALANVTPAPMPTQAAVAPSLHSQGITLFHPGPRPPRHTKARSEATFSRPALKY